MNVKAKGSAGERELAEILRGYGIRAVRNDQIFTGGRENPDIAAEIAGQRLHVEVKRQEKLNVHQAVAQAVRDAAAGALPVVAHRRNREAWLVTVPLEPLIELLTERGIIKNDQ